MADKIVAEYIVKTDQAVKNIDKLQKEVNELLSKGKKSAKDIESNFKKTSSSLISQFSKVGAALGVAFATAQLVSFGKEAVQVAAKAEGISRAFDKLNNPNLLKDLRTATRGTITDLQLMQAAVRAQNFKIPLEQLAGFFQFATNRAIETGESVDYLVESIINGIGRKSSLVLDNLGISASELQEEMKKVGDFGQAAGNIIARELEKAGDVADTTAVKLAQLNTIGENLQVGLGEALINLGAGFAYILGLTQDMDVALTANQKAAKNLAASFGDDLVGATEMMLKKNQELLESQLKIAELEETRTYQNSRQAIANINEAIEAEKERQGFLREYIKQLKSIYDASQKVDEVQKEEIRNVAFLRAAIKELTDERELEGTSVERVKNITQLLIPLQEELNRLLGKETAEQKKLREELEKIALIRSQVFTGAEMAKGIPFVTSLSNTLNGLNKLLKEQKKILEESPEFSKRYNDASDAIDKLEKKIKEFNDDFIDPSLGNPDATAGSFGGLPSTDPDDGECDLECQIAKFQKYANAVSDIVAGISSAIAAGHASELASLESQLESSQITREEYDKKRRKIERQAAIDQKNAAVFQAIINTALAVSSALTVAPPAGYILAGISAALGAVEIGVITSQPLPQFAEGGWVDSKGKIHGRSHAQGGVHLEAEGDEFIINGKMAKKNASLLEALNKGTGQDWINKNMVYPAIQNVIDNGGLERNSGQWGNITASLKDHNIIASQDRMRQSMTHGFKYLAKELKGSNLKRGGYNA